MPGQVLEPARRTARGIGKGVTDLREFRQHDRHFPHPSIRPVCDALESVAIRGVGVGNVHALADGEAASWRSKPSRRLSEWPELTPEQTRQLLDICRTFRDCR